MENLVSNITNIIFGGMSNFANGIGNAFSNFAQNIFLSTDYTLVYTDTPVLIGSITDVGSTSFQYSYNFDLNSLFDYNFVKIQITSFLDSLGYSLVSFSDDNVSVSNYHENLTSGSIPVKLFSYSGSMNSDINNFIVSLFDDIVSVNVIPRADYSVDVFFPVSSDNIIVGGLYLNKFDSIPSYSLNTFGFVTIAFTALALMFGLSRWVLNIINSLGKRNK